MIINKEELKKVGEDLHNNWLWDSNWEFKRIWSLVKRQRVINKLIKEIYFDGGAWSFHNMEMALANLARIHAIEYKSETWRQRYYAIRYKGLIRPYRIIIRRKDNE